MGIPDDLGWRVEQATVTGTLTREGIALSGRLVGAALFICALWVISADSGRKHPAIAIAGPPVGFIQETDGVMTLRSGNRAGTKLSLLTAGIVATVGASMLVAQSPSSGLAFEAASVRPNKSGDLGMRLEPQPGGRFTGTNATPAMLIRFAYDLPDFQVFGGPPWLNSDRFDVIAKAEGDVPLNQIRLMLRRLIAERFKLTVHIETRELPIYALVTARNDGRLGPQLRRTEADCTAAVTPSILGVGPSPAGGPPPCGFFGFAPGTKFSEGRGGLAFRGLTMPALAKMFLPIVRRSVRDSTGLNGHFDGDFEFIAEFPLPSPPPGLPNPFEAPFGSVFTVLPQQLGLKLESTKGPVTVLVIDSVDRPIPE